MPRLNALVLAIGLALGVLADGLFNGAGPGLNLPLWIAALAVAAWRIASTSGWFLALGVFFAACIAWRASPFLHFWNLAAVLAAATAIAVQRRRHVVSAWLRDYVLGAAELALAVTAGAPRAALGLSWPASVRTAYSRHVRASAVGLGLAVPVVLVFGGLLASADPVLEAFVIEIFQWDLRALVRHGAIIGVAGWLSAGWLRSMAAARGVTGPSQPPAPPGTFGLTELAIPLGALTVLLVSFVAVQARYLFGGDAVIRITGLTYAEFARHGFFELVLLTALAMPVLLGARWTVDRASHTAVQSFRAFAVVLSGLIALVMVSALARMGLYISAYGLTEDRLYATAFMTWIGWGFLWFLVTEWRGRADRFATGVVLAGFAVIAALNALNPDGVIARTNLARAAEGLEFDPHYLGRLSTDAVPNVARVWSRLAVEDRCALREGVLGGVGPLEDWREWTWSGWRAARAVEGLPSDGCAAGGAGVPN